MAFKALMILSADVYGVGITGFFGDVVDGVTGFGGMWDTLTAGAVATVDIITGLFGGIGDTFSDVVDNVKSIFNFDWHFSGHCTSALFNSRWIFFKPA